MRRQSLLSVGSVYYWILVALLYLPILLLITFSFNDSTSLVFPLQGFTLKWYAELPNNREMLQAVQISVLLGLGASAVATALGTMGAIAIVRFKFPGRDFFTAVAAMPLVIPYIILGVSLLVLFRAIGFPLSVWAAGLAHVVVCMPYALLVVAARLVGFPRSLEEAAMDLGTTYWGALLRVTLPMCAPAILSAFLMCFTISFDEVAISNFLVGTQPTLPVYLYSQLRFPRRLPLVVTLAAILMTASMVILLSSEWLRRIGQTPTRKGKKA